MNLEFLKILILTLMLANVCFGSSIESCLSAYGVNLSQSFNTNVTLPVECQCSEADLICTNSAINNAQLNDSNFPTLWVLFRETNDSIYFALPKRSLTFWGYKNVVPNAFIGFKFINTDGVNIQTNPNEDINIYFSESYYFPTGTFDFFGNLALIEPNNWPKINIEIVDNDFNSVLNLEEASIGNMNIESMSIKYSGPATYILSSAFEGSNLKRLEIKNSPRFLGFTPLDPNSTAFVSQLIIDSCSSFVLNNTTLPSFTNLNSLTIKSSSVVQIPLNIWAKFSSLLSLSLSANQISYITAGSFSGLENRLMSLDLSSNPITNLDWAVFENFTSLSTLDLSFTSVSTINSFIRLWPKRLKSLILKGYNNTFDNRTICAFNSDILNGRINLSVTFLQVDRSYQCDCFLFYIYKDYRKNPMNLVSDWLLAKRTPACYENLYTQSGNFSLIEQEESACNFPNILDIFCPRTTSSSISLTTTVPCLSNKLTKPGQTTITIGNQTLLTTTPCITTISSEPNTNNNTNTNTTSQTTTQSSTTLSISTNTKYTDISISTELIKKQSSLIPIPNVTNSLSNQTTILLPVVPAESSTALPSLDLSNSSQFNTTSIIIIVLLSAISLLLLFIILGLIIYFRNRLRSVSNGPSSMISSSMQIRIDEKGNKHIYRV